MAPFRRAARAEVKLYLELGGVVALLFLLVDLATVLVPPLLGGGADLAAEGLLERWLEDTLITLTNVYAFAAPIGAVLTLHLLTRRTHALARGLSAVAVAAMAIGAASV